MKLLKNIILIFAMILLIGVTPISASMKPTSLTSSPDTVNNTIGSFIPLNSFTQNKVSILI